MRLLIDEDTAVQLIEPLRHVLFGHDVMHVRQRNRGCQPSHLRQRRKRGNPMAQTAPARPKINTKVTLAPAGQAPRRPVGPGR